MPEREVLETETETAVSIPKRLKRQESRRNLEEEIII